MSESAGPTAPPARPVLVGRTVSLRPGRPGDAERLHAILAEPSVSRWWGQPDPAEDIAAALRSDGPVVLLVAEIGGEVAGGIQYDEEHDRPVRPQRGRNILGWVRLPPPSGHRRLGQDRV